MKFITAYALLLSCLASPANSSSDFRGVVADPDSIDEDEVHRNLQRVPYLQPSWWDYIIQNPIPGTVNLKRCRRKTLPPKNGASCAPRVKTCHFGEQICQGIGAAGCAATGPYPTTTCFCNGQGFFGTWSCKPLTCKSCCENSICGSVWEDVTGDTNGDIPLADATMSLVDAAGNLLATTLTGTDGGYCFEDLPAPAMYRIYETNPVRYDDVSDIDMSNGPNEIKVNLGCVSVSTGNDFVDEKSSSIMGVVIEDCSSYEICGSVETTFALQGVLVELFNKNNVLVEHIWTDVFGKYCFSASLQAPQVYTIRETNLSGYTDVSDSDGGNVNQITVDFAQCANSYNHDFVDAAVPANTITGTVSEPCGSGFEICGSALIDIDNDGTGDINHPGVLIELLNRNNALVDSVQTDSSGKYCFSSVGLSAGGQVYTIRETNEPPFIRDVTDADGGNLNEITVDFPSCMNVLGRDFVDK